MSAEPGKFVAGHRQLTGTGFRYRGWVAPADANGRVAGDLRSCCEREHRKARAAQRCAERLARSLEREGVAS